MLANAYRGWAFLTVELLGGLIFAVLLFFFSLFFGVASARKCADAKDGKNG